MRILFQGDSITDAGRIRERDDLLGLGYPLLVSANLGHVSPGKYEFFNRGISGNRIVDLYARIKIDIINIKPDVISILIGVNDVWHEIACHNGISSDRYEVFLRMMLDDVKKFLPNTKIIIMEPFITHGTSTDRAWEYFCSEIEKRIETVRKLSAEYSVRCVHLQDEFNNAVKSAHAENWTLEGVHPTPAGNMIIKNAWLKVFNNGNL